MRSVALYLGVMIFLLSCAHVERNERVPEPCPEISEDVLGDYEFILETGILSAMREWFEDVNHYCKALES